MIRCHLSGLSTVWGDGSGRLYDVICAAALTTLVPKTNSVTQKISEGMKVCLKYVVTMCDSQNAHRRRFRLFSDGDLLILSCVDNSCLLSAISIWSTLSILIDPAVRPVPK